MMNTYKVQRMTEKDYANYMLGGFNFCIETIEVEAENEAEAAKLAAVNGYRVNANAIKTIDEAAEAKREAKAAEVKRATEATAKIAAAVAKKNAKAAAMGMTIEQYEEAQKLKAKKARYNREIAEAEAMIAKLQKEITRKKNFIENN